MLFVKSFSCLIRALFCSIFRQHCLHQTTHAYPHWISCAARRAHRFCVLRCCDCNSALRSGAIEAGAGKDTERALAQRAGFQARAMCRTRPRSAVCGLRFMQRGNRAPAPARTLMLGGIRRGEHRSACTASTGVGCARRWRSACTCDGTADCSSSRIAKPPEAERDSPAQAGSRRLDRY